MVCSPWRQAVGNQTFSWLHQKDAAEGRLLPTAPCFMAGGGQGTEKWQQRNWAALQPFKTISKKCVPRIELLLKGMIAKVTCFRRVVLFVTRTL